MKAKRQEIEGLLADLDDLGYGDLRTFYIDAVTGIKLVEKLKNEYRNAIIIRNQNPHDLCNNKLVLSLQYLMEGINP